MLPRRIEMTVLRERIVSLIVDVLIVLVLVALVWAVVGIAEHVWLLITGGLPDAFKGVTAEVLSVFIFIEIFNALVEYLKERRIRATHLADATLAFVLREVWVTLYASEAGWERIGALSALVLAIGLVRTLAIVYSPGEREQTPER